MHLFDTFRRQIRFGPRIGLSVTPEWVGAVVIRGDDVKWSLAETLGPEETLEGAICRTLERLLVAVQMRWPRPRVWVAIDTPQSRVKTIRGLPPVTDDCVIAQLLATTPERFFVGSTGGLAITRARVATPGVAEAAAFDAGMLDAIQGACAGVGLETILFVPAAVAISAVPDDVDVNSAQPALAAAYGATEFLPRDPLTAQRVRPDQFSSAHYRRRLIVAGAVAAASTGMALVTPATLALHTSRRARQVIAALAPARAKTLGTERDVTMMTAAITTVQRFESSRISKTLLLSQLTQSLPAAATIAALTIDTAATTVVVLAPHAADVVHALEEMLGATHVEMIGPVTREFVAATSPLQRASSTLPTELERVTVRFHLTSEGSTARRPLGETE